MLLGDSLLFVLGRYMGWGLLGFLCKLSVNPETCILRSAESFYKRGKATLLFAKFIPGINTMAPPLAGSMKMRPDIFLRFDVAGASLYAMVYIAAGYLFRDVLASLAHGFQTAGRAVETVTMLALIGYAGYRVWLYRKHAVYRVVPRVQVEELARRLSSESRLLRCRRSPHTRFDPHGTEQHRGRGQNAAQGQGHLRLLYLSTRSDQRPGGAYAAGARIQRVRNRRRAGRMA